jgi:hypothetical protein
MDLSGLNLYGSEYGQVSGSYDISDEVPSFIKFREFLEKLRKFYFTKNDSVPSDWSILLLLLLLKMWAGIAQSV